MRASSSRALRALSAEPATSAMGLPNGTKKPTHVEKRLLLRPILRLSGKWPAPKNGALRVSMMAAPRRAATFSSDSSRARSSGSELSGGQFSRRLLSIAQIWPANVACKQSVPGINNYWLTLVADQKAEAIGRVARRFQNHDLQRPNPNNVAVMSGHAVILRRSEMGDI